MSRPYNRAPLQDCVTRKTIADRIAPHRPPGLREKRGMPSFDSLVGGPG